MTLSPDRRYSERNYLEFNNDSADDTYDDLDESLLVSPAQQITERPQYSHTSENEVVEDHGQNCTDDKNTSDSIGSSDEKLGNENLSDENSKHSSPLTPASGNKTHSSSESLFSSGIRTPVTSEKFSYAAALEQLEELAPSAVKAPRPTASTATLSPGSTVVPSIFRFPCIRKDNIDEDIDLELRRSCPVHDSTEEAGELECGLNVKEFVAELTSGDGDEMIEEVDGSDDESLVQAGILTDVNPVETSISSSSTAIFSISESNVIIDHNRFDGDEPIPADEPSVSISDEVSSEKRKIFSGFSEWAMTTDNERVVDKSVACDQANLASVDQGDRLLDNSSLGVPKINEQQHSQNCLKVLGQEVEPTVGRARKNDSLIIEARQYDSTTLNQPLPESEIFGNTELSRGIGGSPDCAQETFENQKCVTSSNASLSNSTNRPDNSGRENPLLSVPIDSGSHQTEIYCPQLNHSAEDYLGRNQHADLDGSSVPNSETIETKFCSQTSDGHPVYLENDCATSISFVRAGRWKESIASQEESNGTVNLTSIASKANWIKVAKDDSSSASLHRNQQSPIISCNNHASDPVKCNSKPTEEIDTKVEATNDIFEKSENDVNPGYSMEFNGPEVAATSLTIENNSSNINALESSSRLKPPIDSLLPSSEPFAVNVHDSFSPISKSSSPHNCDILHSAIEKQLGVLFEKDHNDSNANILQGNSKAAKHSIFDILSEPNDVMHDILDTHQPENTIEKDSVIDVSTGIGGESLINESGPDREEEDRRQLHELETLAELTSNYDDYDSNDDGVCKRKSHDGSASFQKKYDSTSSEFLMKLRNAAESRKREVTRCRQSLERKKQIFMEESNIFANLPTVHEGTKQKTSKTSVSYLPKKKQIEGMDPYKPFRARPVPVTVSNPDNKGESDIPIVAKRASTSPGGLLSGSKPIRDFRGAIATSQRNVDADRSRQSLRPENDHYTPFRAKPLPATHYSRRSTVRPTKPSVHQLGAKRKSAPHQIKPSVTSSAPISKPPKRLLSGKEASASKESKLRSRIQDEEEKSMSKSAFRARPVSSAVRERAEQFVLLGETLLDSCKENYTNKSVITVNEDAERKMRSTTAFIPRSSFRAKERAAYEVERVKRERESRDAKIRRRKELINKTASEIEKLKDSI
ncbi:hypothetical protein ACHAXS_011675 [Conticribra weissflogii]